MCNIWEKVPNSVINILQKRDIGSVHGLSIQWLLCQGQQHHVSLPSMLVHVMQLQRQLSAFPLARLIGLVCWFSCWSINIQLTSHKARQPSTVQLKYDSCRMQTTRFKNKLRMHEWTTTFITPLLIVSNAANMLWMLLTLWQIRHIFNQQGYFILYENISYHTPYSISPFDQVHTDWKGQRLQWGVTRLNYTYPATLRICYIHVESLSCCTQHLLLQCIALYLSCQTQRTLLPHTVKCSAVTLGWLGSKLLNSGLGGLWLKYCTVSYTGVPCYIIFPYYDCHSFISFFQFMMCSTR